MSARSGRAYGAERMVRWSLERIVLIAPMALGVHGVVILSLQSGTVTEWALVGLVGLMGVVGVVGSGPRVAAGVQAVLVLGSGSWLIVSSDGTGSLFLLWLFVLVAVYPGALPRRLALGLTFVAAAFYGLLPVFQTSVIPLAVVVSRSFLLLVIGLMVATLAASRDRANAFDRRFRVLFESASDAIIAVDENMLIVLLNEEAEVIFGYSRSEMVGQPLELLIPQRFRDQHRHHFQGFIDGDITRRLMSSRPELSGIRKDGEEFPIEVTIAKLDEKNSFAATAVVRDVTDRHAVEQALKARESALETLVRSKDELIASISHEMRTPLTAVLGFAQILREEASGLSAEERAEMLKSIVEEGTDLTNIVDDLLVAAKAEAGTLAVLSVPVDLRAQTAQVLAAWSQQEVVEHIEVTGLSVTAMGDHARVRQILRNLISNALYYGGSRIRISLSADDSTARVAVSDDGPGIPPEERERIFEAYQRSHHTPGLTASMGLGLTISRQLARLMGGDLTHSRQDGETTFELVLPTVN